MEGDLNLLQVVGFKNSGKTTLIERVLSECKKAGKKAGVIKHHGHGCLEVHDRKKDTGRFRESGAAVTGIAAGNELELEFVDESDWEVERIVELYRYLPLDVILVEGFKHADFPKVVMLKQKDDYQAFQELKNIQAVVTWDSRLTGSDHPSIFHIFEQDRYMAWILSRLGVKPGE
ncbi:MAG TPA: molybdopterin-guanine dinucleotide biosynthesis protein B [Bacillales bacterium]|nr:molybdopterin-guanine dinucleotide biosynthesis protein B [Bacillales bacterium]